jgi:hypothetical protein
MASIIKANELQDFGGNSIITSDGAGTITLSSGMNTAVAVGTNNTPAFSVYKASNFDISDNVDTKVPFDTETYDTNSAFASNKFTVPSGQDGKYFFYSRVRFQKSGVSQYVIAMRKNNSEIAKRYIYSGGGGTNIATIDYFSYDVSCNVTLSVGDYIEVFILMDSTDGGACTVNGGTVHNEFSGYKIIT